MSNIFSFADTDEYPRAKRDTVEEKTEHAHQTTHTKTNVQKTKSISYTTHETECYTQDLHMYEHCP